jgi:aerobic C4-dicarboxylate transport protein
MATKAIRPAIRPHQPWYKILYIQVLIAIALGILIGYFDPDLGKQLKPLGDGFIALIKMMIAPVIFCTVVHGISSMGDLKRVGRVGLKALIYFEAVSTVALAVGLIVGEVLQPGKRLQHRPGAARSQGHIELRHARQGRGHRRPSAGDHP